MRLRTTVWVACVAAGVSFTAAAAPALTVGDPAPKLHTLQWIKGAPEPELKKGRAYVVEFWATWCVPCVAAMPHLSGLAKKYQAQATFIGIHLETKDSLREQAARMPAGEYLAGIRKFVQRKGDKLAYTVAVDDPARYSIGKSWFEAAGLTGIPATFVIDREGKIAWIGHPMEVDEPLAQVLNGSIDLAAARAKHQAEVAANEKGVTQWNELMGGFLKAMEKHDYAAALVEADKIIAANPDDKGRLLHRMHALLGADENKGLAYARTLLADEQFMRSMDAPAMDGGSNAPLEIAVTIAVAQGLSRSAYEYAVVCMRKALEQYPDSWRGWGNLSWLYQHRLNEMDAALQAQHKAVAAAEKLGEQQGELARARLDSLKDLASQTRTIAFDTDEGTAMSLDVAPDGKEIVFDLLGDIYTLPIEGGQARLLVGGRGWDIRPRYTLDGKHIVFLRDEGTGDYAAGRKVPSMTWRVGRDGSGAQAHDEDLSPMFAKIGMDRAAGVWTYRPVVSRSGKWLAYFRQAPGAGASLQLRSLRTGEERKLLDIVDSAGLLDSGVPGPDGQPILTNPGWGDDATDAGFAAGVFLPDDSAIVLSMGGKLWRAPLAGGAPQLIPFRASVVQQIAAPIQPRAQRFSDGPMQMQGIRTPVITADGRMLVFGAVEKLWVQDLRTGAIRRLTNSGASEEAAAISPDGRWVAYLAYEDAEQGANGEPATRAQVMLAGLSPAAKNPRPLLAARADYGPPVWSADSARVVFACPDPASKSDAVPERRFCRVDRNGSAPSFIGPEPKRQLRHARDAIRARVGTDDRRLYYIEQKMTRTLSGVALTADIMSVNLDGTDRHRHLTILDDIEVAALSPDARRALVGPRSASGAYIVNIPAREEQPENVSLTDATVRQVSQSPVSSAYWQNDKTAICGLGPKIWRIGDGERQVSDFHTVNLSLPRHRAKGAFAVRGARIITMSGERGREWVIERGTLVVENGRLTRVGDEDLIRIPAGAKVIDGKGLTLIPGLIDVHYHADLGTAWRRPLTDPSSVSMLAYGVTSIFDPSASVAPTDVELERAELIETGGAVGPRYFYSGHSLTPVDYPVYSPAAASQIAGSFASLGAVVLKEYQQEKRSRRQMLAAAAARWGVGITAEGVGLNTLLSMVIDGYTALEHFNFVLPAYRDAATFMARSGVSFTPTVNTERGGYLSGQYFFYQEMLREDPAAQTKLRRFMWDSHLSHYAAGGEAAQAIPFERRRLAQAAQLAARIIDMGGTVAIGMHNTPGIFTHWEMWAIQRGGASPMDVLRAGTLNGARKLGIDKELGTLEAGKLADFVVLTANPLKDIRNSLKIKYVVASGAIYDGETLAQLWPSRRPLPRMGWQASNAR